MNFKNSLAAIASLFLLTSCEHQHVDENKDHLCDVCKMILSEHKDENNDHFCDYCEDQLNGCIDEDLDGKCDICGKDVEPVVPYAVWPEKEIQDEVIVVSGSSVKIPAYEKADDIEINTDDEVESGYFSIYCYTENTKSQNEYREILLDAGWEVSVSKNEQGYFDAYDPDYEVNINFGYFEEFSDLEICIAFCYKTKWPAKDIADYLKILVPTTNIIIPEFYAYTTKVNFYNSELIRAIAINAYGFNDSIINDYKTALENNNWTISFNEYSQEWNAISEDELVELHFYIDSSKAEFNVDIFEAKVVVENWPYDEINNVITDLGATGEVVPFKGECTGFTVEASWLPPVICVFCEISKQEFYANQYNESLMNLGYIEVRNSWDEPCYALPGTTLAYRATVVAGVLEIEMFKLSEPAK